MQALFSDIHTHSIASGHGSHDTVSSMAREASLRGLKLLGISDHAPATMASATASYFRALPLMSRRRFGIELLFGAELNILDENGRLDLSEDILPCLDYAIVSMHVQNYRPGSRTENTAAFVSAMSHPCVKVLGHCDQELYPLNYPVLVRAAKESKVLIEINEASVSPGGYRGDTRKNDIELLSLCAEFEVPIVLTSDSHGKERIGECPCSLALVHEQCFPEKLIYNNQLALLKAFLADRS